MITLTLNSDLGPYTTAADYAAWTDYVAARIDEACGFEVSVETVRFPRQTDSQNDEISHDDGTTMEQDAAREQTIREAIARLWEQGCADNFGLPRARKTTYR